MQSVEPREDSTFRSREHEGLLWKEGVGQLHGGFATPCASPLSGVWWYAANISPEACLFCCLVYKTEPWLMGPPWHIAVFLLLAFTGACTAAQGCGAPWPPRSARFPQPWDPCVLAPCLFCPGPSVFSRGGLVALWRLCPQSWLGSTAAPPGLAPVSVQGSSLANRIFNNPEKENEFLSLECVPNVI